jgi:hypothetical protein
MYRQQCSLYWGSWAHPHTSDPRLWDRARVVWTQHKRSLRWHSEDESNVILWNVGNHLTMWSDNPEDDNCFLKKVFNYHITVYNCYLSCFLCTTKIKGLNFLSLKLEVMLTYKQHYNFLELKITWHALLSINYCYGCQISMWVSRKYPECIAECVQMHNCSTSQFFFFQCT